jgi:hypothetical protein
MKTGAISRWAARLAAVTAAAVLLTYPAQAAEPVPKEAPNRLTMIDFDACELVQLRAAIMEVRAEKGTIVVAEREIREMDVESGGRQIRTKFLNAEGKPMARPVFHTGDYVQIKGFLHPEGYVAAAEVQRIEKPKGKPVSYTPVAKQKKSIRRPDRRGADSAGAR